MERAKRRLYVCLLVVCLTAVVLGLIYYSIDMNHNEVEKNGTLVFGTGKEI